MNKYNRIVKGLKALKDAGLVELVGRCPCGSLRINGRWYSPDMKITFVNMEVKYSDTICSKECMIEYYLVKEDVADVLYEKETGHW